MKLDIYLNYRGNCEQAFRFYEQHLGGKITSMMRHGELPDQGNVPADWKNAILHARIVVRDRFGTSWMLLHERQAPQPPTPTRGTAA